MVLKRTKKQKLNAFVFLSSSLALLALCFFTIFWPQQSAAYLNKAQSMVSYSLSWYYMLLIVVCFVFVAWLALSPYGKICLGQEATPEFSYLSWVSMLFSAGIGIALVYFGSYEPVEHFLHPPTGAGANAQAAQYAMVLTFLHWGLHGWALYALLGTVLAYYAYIEDRPLAIRTPLFPLFSLKATKGILGDITDAFSIVATIIAMVTNLGLSALLMQAGLARLSPIFSGTNTLIYLLLFMTLCAAVVSTIQIEKGLAVLSKIGIFLLCFLLGFIFICGPTAHLLDGLVQNVGDYLDNFIHLSFHLYLFEKADAWRGIWTIFYWAWWIAWAPFVGLFIARISKGRTIRELIFGVLLIPLGFTLVWLSIFGNTALDLIFMQGKTMLGTAIIKEPEMALYTLLSALPLAKITLFVAIFLSFILFFAPVDSGSVMIASLALHTDHAEEAPPAWLKIFWCIATCFVTIGLFLSGNFTAIQTAVVLCGLPFSVILIFYMISFVKTLKNCNPLQKRLAKEK